jgi:hypothetical protein
MSFAALVIACIALAVSLVNLAANIEIFASITSLRKATRISDDELLPLEQSLLQQVSPAAIRRHTQTASLRARGFLFLSTRCETCNAIAFDMKGRPPAEMLVVVVAETEADARLWAERYGIAQHFVADERGQLSAHCGINVYPTLILLDADDQLVGGWAVPSLRQAERILDDHSERNKTIKEEAP